MSGREVGYYGPSDRDLGCGCLTLVFGFVGLLLMVALVVMSFAGCASGEVASAGASSPAVEDSGEAGRTDLAVDVTDPHAMHELGLPTKTDVISWHVYGRWGFSTVEDGVHTEHIFEDLPGGALVWDALYEVDGANPAFKFR